MIRNFKAFMLRGNVVDLAVAVVVGTAFTAVVTGLVQDLITPLIAAVFGRPDFSALTFSVHGSIFRYGDLVNRTITFLSVAAAVFFIVVVPVNALLARAHREPPAEPTSRKCPECLSTIPMDARRCAYCTAPLGEVAA